MPSSAAPSALTLVHPIIEVTGILMRPADTDAGAAFLHEAA
ncbi:hypothetical protein [uncultured Xanthomonas sp.]|nr:hypothetical protein [uncultured Xanthomonas sp.]